MPKKYLHGVESDYVKLNNDPIMGFDAARKSYVDSHDIPSGGALGQMLVKLSATSFDTAWIDNPAEGTHMIGFFNADGTEDNLDLSVFHRLPFYNADGTRDDIDDSESTGHNHDAAYEALGHDHTEFLEESEIIDLIAQNPPPSANTNPYLNSNPYFDFGILDYEAIDPYSDAYITNEITDSGSNVLTFKGTHRTSPASTNSIPTLVGSTYFPVRTDNEYRATIRHRALFDGAEDPDYTIRHYIGTKSYDAEGHGIFPYSYLHQHTNFTELATSLTNGDMVINLVDGTGWQHNAAAHQNTVRLYPQQADGGFRYVAPNGHGYDNFTGDITKNIYSRLYSYGAIAGISGNTITLSAPWNKGNFAAGDKIVQSSSGGTFQYWLVQSCPLTAEFTEYQSAWLSGTSYSVCPNGTGKAQLMLLPSYRLYHNGVWVQDPAITSKLQVWFSVVGLQERPKL